MINKEYGEFVGNCDDCLTETGTCDNFQEAINVMQELNWKTILNEVTGEWENVCPECLKNRRKDKPWLKISNQKLDQNSSTEQTK